MSAESKMEVRHEALPTERLGAAVQAAVEVVKGYSEITAEIDPEDVVELEEGGECPDGALPVLIRWVKTQTGTVASMVRERRYYYPELFHDAMHSSDGCVPGSDGQQQLSADLVAAGVSQEDAATIIDALLDEIGPDRLVRSDKFRDSRVVDWAAGATNFYRDGRVPGKSIITFEEGKEIITNAYSSAKDRYTDLQYTSAQDWANKNVRAYAHSPADAVVAYLLGAEPKMRQAVVSAITGALGVEEAKQRAGDISVLQTAQTVLTQVFEDPAYDIEPDLEDLHPDIAAVIREVSDKARDFARREGEKAAEKVGEVQDGVLRQMQGFIDAIPHFRTEDDMTTFLDSQGMEGEARQAYLGIFKAFQEQAFSSMFERSFGLGRLAETCGFDDRSLVRRAEEAGVTGRTAVRQYVLEHAFFGEDGVVESILNSANGSKAKIGEALRDGVAQQFGFKHMYELGGFLKDRGIEDVSDWISRLVERTAYVSDASQIGGGVDLRIILAEVSKILYIYAGQRIVASQDAVDNLMMQLMESVHGLEENGIATRVYKQLTTGDQAGIISGEGSYIGHDKTAMWYQMETLDGKRGAADDLSVEEPNYRIIHDQASSSYVLMEIIYALGDTEKSNPTFNIVASTVDRDIAEWLENNAGLLFTGRDADTLQKQ